MSVKPAPNGIKDHNAFKYDIPTADSLISNDSMGEEGRVVVLLLSWHLFLILARNSGAIVWSRCPVPLKSEAILYEFTANLPTNQESNTNQITF